MDVEYKLIEFLRKELNQNFVVDFVDNFVTIETEQKILINKVGPTKWIVRQKERLFLEIDLTQDSEIDNIDYKYQILRNTIQLFITLLS